jgi:hypothetical protein
MYRDLNSRVADDSQTVGKNAAGEGTPWSACLILRDYSLEGTTAVMRNSYAVTNLNPASIFHPCLRFYIGGHRAEL